MYCEKYFQWGDICTEHSTCNLSRRPLGLRTLHGEIQKGAKLEFKKTNVLGSSSIRTCRILTIEYLLLFFAGRCSRKKSKQIFKIQHV